MYTKKPMPIGTGPSIACVFSHLSVTKGMIYLSRSFRGCVLPGLREILLAKGIKRRPDSFRGMTHATSVTDILLPQWFKRPDTTHIPRKVSIILCDETTLWRSSVCCRGKKRSSTLFAFGKDRPRCSTRLNTFAAACEKID